MLLLNRILNNFFIIYFHISSLDASGFARDNQHKQEVTDSKDKEEINDIELSTVPKIEESTTSLSSSTKLKRRTASNEVSPKL